VLTGGNNSMARVTLATAVFLPDRDVGFRQRRHRPGDAAFGANGSWLNLAF
jgi:hypothetical protein